MWRSEDEALFLRLEDEIVVARLFALFTGSFVSLLDVGKEVGKGTTSDSSDAEATTRVGLPARAAGLVGEIRKLPGGQAVVTAAARGEVAALGHFVDAIAVDVRARTPPALLHHLAVFHARAADVLAPRRPEEAATAWVRAFAAWLALGEERSYLQALEDRVLGPAAGASARDVRIDPGAVPLEWLAGVGARARESARDLAPAGQAALGALARTEESAKLAGVDPALARRASAVAERDRKSVV